MKPWWGGKRRTAWILPTMLPSTVYCNPADAPEPNPEEFCTGGSKEPPFGASAGNTPPPPTPPPSSGCLGKLLVTYQNPTQLSSLPETLPCPTSERANHTLHSSTSQPSTKTVQAQNTQLLIIYQEPSTDQKVLEIPQWTRWARSLLATNV